MQAKIKQKLKALSSPKFIGYALVGEIAIQSNIAKYLLKTGAYELDHKRFHYTYHI